MPAPDFRRFVTSIALALTADQLFIVALTWAAMHSPNGAMTLGSVLMVAALTRAATTPLGGFGADRFRPIRTLVGVYTVRAVIVGGLAIAASLDQVSNPTALHAAGLLFGLLAGMGVSPQMSAISTLVSPERIARGNAIVQGTMQLSIVIGPPLAGWMLARWAVGGTWIVCAVLTFCAGMTLWSRGSQGRESGTPDAGLDADADASHKAPSLAEALRAQPVLLAILVVMGLLYLGLMGPVQVGIPARVTTALGDDPELLGMLLGCFGAGMLLGTIAAARVNRPPKVGYHMLGALGFTAIGLSLVGLVSGTSGTLVGLTMGGIGMGYFNVTGLSWLHRSVPGSAQGRVLGLVMFSANITATLSPLWAGWLAGDGLVDRVFLVGAAMMGMACVVSLAVPQLRNLRNLSPDPDPAPE